MIPRIQEASWWNTLYTEYRKDYFLDLEAFLSKQRKDGKIILPIPHTDIFRAFDLCPLYKTKVVILGQDPYINASQANGLAFSVPKLVKLPPSLINLFRELKSDLRIVNEHGDLAPWAMQGVLLLNTILTVDKGTSNSHAGKGWERFTDKALEATCRIDRAMVYILLGKHAQMKKNVINANRSAPTLIIEAAHPSPLSANKGGFYWTRPFSKTNRFLKEHGLVEIDWNNK